MRDGKHTSFLFTLDRREENLQSIVFAAGPAGPMHAIVPPPDRGLEAVRVGEPPAGEASHAVAALHQRSSRTPANQGVGGTTLPEAGVDDRGHEAQVIFGARSVLNGAAAQRVPPAGRARERVDGQPPSGSADRRARRLHRRRRAGRSAHDRGSLQPRRGADLRARQAPVQGGLRRCRTSAGAGSTTGSNREGTFTFASLEDYALGRPLSFLQQRGDGHIVFLQKVFGAFVQDQISVSDRLSITPGLRYDWQNIFTDNNNVAPRLSASRTRSNKKTVDPRRRRRVLRSRRRRADPRGAALARGSAACGSSCWIRRIPIRLRSGPADAPARSIVTLSPDIRIPYTFQYGVGLERVVRKGRPSR